MSSIKWFVEHIDYLSIEPVAGWAPGEVEVSQQMDDRTFRRLEFKHRKDAIDYVHSTKLVNGKWLATIKLKRIMETEEDIDD